MTTTYYAVQYLNSSDPDGDDILLSTHATREDAELGLRARAAREQRPWTSYVVTEWRGVRFSFATDAGWGEVFAADIDTALDLVRPTDAAIEDGGWAWVKGEDGERRSVGAVEGRS